MSTDKTLYKHTDKMSGDGLAIQDWNNLSSAVGGSSSLGLALHPDYNVGIGTDAASAKLDVVNTVKVRGAWSTEARLHGRVYMNDENFGMGAGRFATGGADDNLYFWAYKEPGRDIRFLHTTNGQTAPTSDSWSTDLIIKHDGKVGIGTTTPSARLDVSGEVKADKFTGDGSGLTNLSVGLRGLNLATQSGNVGIGTTSPTEKLTVQGTIRGNQLILENAGETDVLFNDTANGQSWQVGANANGFYAYDNAYRLVVKKGGNVGIGTRSPAAALSISGDGKERNPDGSMHLTDDCILFGGKNSGRQMDSAQISAGLHVANSLNLVGMASGTEGSDRKIDLWAEGALTVHGNSNDWKVTMDDKKLSFTLTKAYHGNSARTISWDGDSNWDYTSDARLKTNIQPEEGILPRLLKLPVKRYQWRDADGRDPQKIGFMAQDVQPHFPELVGQQTNADTCEENLSLKYANFGVLAVGGLQELKADTDATIAAQAAVIRQLQERLAALEARLAD